MSESVTVTVSATWRLSRVEFALPWDSLKSVVGYGEILLGEDPGSPGPAMMKRRAVGPAPLAAAEGNGVYGTMPSTSISRSIDEELLASTVDVDGVTTDFKTVLLTLRAFFDKWRLEDETKPDPMAVPEGAKLTPVTVPPVNPPMGEDLPPPRPIS